MIEMTELAMEKLKKFQDVEGKEKPVRIALMSGAAQSPKLGVISDDRKDGDDAYNFEGLLVIIDTKLMEYCQSITIDYVKTENEECKVEGGFKISPAVSL